MSNHLKFCSCKSCRAGRHRPGSKAATRRRTRGARHKAKTDLAKGREPSKVTSIDYTD